MSFGYSSIERSDCSEARHRTAVYVFDRSIAVMSGTSSIGTLMHLLKGNIGTGVLAIPQSFINAGLLVGLFGIPAVGIVAVHCMHILLKCQKRLCTRHQLDFMNYEEVAEKAALAGPNWLNKRASWVKFIVSLFLLIAQFGCCCVYSLFVALNIQEFIRNVSNEAWIVSAETILIIELPIMILICCVRDLKGLAIASAAANLIQIVGLTIIFYNLFEKLPTASKRPLTADVTKLPLFFGTAVYTFEGVGIVLPLKNGMKKPDTFGGYFGVLNTGMTIVTCLYTAIGFFGYLKYGDDLLDSITLNMPKTPFYQLVPFMFALAVFASFALQFYVSFNIIWPYLETSMNLVKDTKKSRCTEYFCRAALVSAIFLLAAAIPKLNLCISLVGAISSSCLALVIPPLVELATFWEDKSVCSNWKFLVAKNILITLMGLVGSVTGTFTAVTEILKEIRRTV